MTPLCRFLTSEVRLTKLHFCSWQGMYRLISQKYTERRSISTSGKLLSSEIILKSKFPNVEKIVGVTLPELLWASSKNKNWKKSTAFECGLTGAKLSHDEVYKNSKAFAAALLQTTGLQRRDRIGIVLQNNIHFAAILIGIMDAGMIPCLFNPMHQPVEMLRQVQDSDCKSIITSPEFLPVVRNLKESYPNLQSIIILGPPHDGCHTYSEMIKTDTTGVHFLKGSEVDTSEEICLLPYSSGTTGLPKGVSLTHFNIVSHLSLSLQPGCLEMKCNGEERMIGVLPFFHSFGFTTFPIFGVFAGAHTLCLPKFDSNTFLKAVREHKPTILHLVPPLLLHLIGNSDYGPKEFENVHTIVGGAAPVGRWVIEKLLEKANKYFLFQEVYGMTESTGAFVLLPEISKNTKIGSSGTLYPNTLLKVITTDGSGRSLGPNEHGEICVKGSQVMKGYWRNEAATRATIDSDDWLHTGDIGYYDDTEYLYIVDRLKDLIKVKGYQVAPAELEEILRQHPNIAEVAVIGIPNSESGELPRAYIVAKNSNLVADEINSFLKDKVSYYKQLKGGIEFVNTLPKSPSGKLLRRQLKIEYFSKTWD